VTARVLILGAGSAAGENLIRSLRTADPSLTLLGGHDDRFVLKRSAAAARYLLPPPRSRTFVRAVRRLVDERHVDLVVPTSDAHVQALSDGRRRLGRALFLPDRAVVALCQDKYRLTRALRRHGIPAPVTYPVTTLAAIDDVFARFGRRPVWCRPRTGTCARGGSAVESPDQARAWIRLWQTMQGLPVRSFTLSEYLPGREILCQSVWDRGRLVLANTFERLSYFGVDNIPSGVTSLSSLAKTVITPTVVEVCRRAVGAIAPAASGAFSIDVKEDAAGRPHVTEINAGRFFMAMTAFDRVLKHNMALTYVQLALGARVEFGETYDAADDYYMARDLDVEPAIFHADDVFDGIDEVGA
jgi:glutathione synthase/RimK-type ligase-like ATP-grasp enzyme